MLNEKELRKLHDSMLDCKKCEAIWKKKNKTIGGASRQQVSLLEHIKKDHGGKGVRND